MKKFEKIQATIKEFNEKTGMNLIIETTTINNKNMFNVYNDSISKNGAYTFKNLREVECYVGGYIASFCNTNGLSSFTYEKLSK